MPAIEFKKGTEAIEEAVRASLYEAVLDILGATGTILPIGDPKHGLLTASTFTTVGGEQVTFTWSEPPNDFDTKPGYKALVPVVNFNGSDEEADTPDAAYWTRDDGASQAFSIGIWVRLDALGGITLAKFNQDAAIFEWTQTVETGRPRFRVSDDSAGVIPERQVDAGAALSTDTWYFVVTVYDAADGAWTGATAMDFVTHYVDGAVRASTATNNASYVAMEDGTSEVTLAHRQDGVGGAESLFNGKIAGGPMGPFFVQKALTADEVLRLYEIGRRALGL